MRRGRRQASQTRHSRIFRNFRQPRQFMHDTHTYTHPNMWCLDFGWVIDVPHTHTHILATTYRHQLFKPTPPTLNHQTRHSLLPVLRVLPVLPLLHLLLMPCIMMSVFVVAVRCWYYSDCKCSTYALHSASICWLFSQMQITSRQRWQRRQRVSVARWRCKGNRKSLLAPSD